MTYTTKTFSLISRADGTRLFGLCVAPEEPVAILQMAHGMAEHKERYLPFMEYLAERGFACFLHDHRGHGQSVDRPEKLGWFGPDGGENLVKDLRQMADYAVSKFPGLPLYLFGHSMGSLAVRCYLRDHEQTLNGLIVCGSPSENPAAGPGAALCKVIGKTKGWDYRSPLLQGMTTGGFGKAFAAEKLENAWLTRDKTIVEAYNADPLCGFAFTANGYLALMELLKGAYAPVQAKNPRLPVHFLSGEQDPCHGGKVKFLGAVDKMRKHGWHEVTWKLYPEMRHEVLNEFGKEQVMEDLHQLLLGWLKKR